MHSLLTPCVVQRTIQNSSRSHSLPWKPGGIPGVSQQNFCAISIASINKRRWCGFWLFFNLRYFIFLNVLYPSNHYHSRKIIHIPRMPVLWFVATSFWLKTHSVDHSHHLGQQACLIRLLYQPTWPQKMNSAYYKGYSAHGAWRPFQWGVPKWNLCIISWWQQFKRQSSAYWGVCLLCHFHKFLVQKSF